MVGVRLLIAVVLLFSDQWKAVAWFSSVSDVHSHSWVSVALRGITLACIHFLETYPNHNRYLPTSNPSLVVSLKKEWLTLWRLAFCHQKGGRSSQCSCPHNMSNTSTRTHTNICSLPCFCQCLHISILVSRWLSLFSFVFSSVSLLLLFLLFLI